ncbi:uncharacterized protein LOC143022577 [Oratosquilla oratoria]|uniref:uncharacterized protein LOC143022577 n=1 Tax=Oratosquilla oratoria TaxID=337810 RepID=UPI003F767E5F
MLNVSESAYHAWTDIKICEPCSRYINLPRVNSGGTHERRSLGPTIPDNVTNKIRGYRKHPALLSILLHQEILPSQRYITKMNGGVFRCEVLGEMSLGAFAVSGSLGKRCLEPLPLSCNPGDRQVTR